MAMDSSKLATVAVKSAITMIYPTQLVYSCHAKILISMKLDSELPAYYSTTTQSGYNKRRIVAISDNYEETVDLFVARRVRAYLMDFICASLLYVPVESFARLWLRLLLYVGAYAPCDLMESATHVVSYYRGEPRSVPMPLVRTGEHTYFDYQYIRYRLTNDGTGFTRIAPIEFEKGPPLAAQDVTRRQAKYGPSSYSVHISPSTLKAVVSIFKDQVLLSPLIYFEAFCVLIWTITKYTTYTVVIVSLVAIERFVAMRQSYQTWCHLHAISSSADNQEVTVVRLDENGKEYRPRVCAKDIVPGDHIIVTPNLNIPCDCVLIKGEVIVDVSFVTGESRANRCVAVPPGKNVRSITSSLLLCGSKALRTRAPGGSFECRAIVVANGFHTLQGNFLLSVLFRDPSPAEQRVEQWLVRSVATLMLLALVFMTYAYFASVSLNLHPTEITVRVLDLLTDALPPALPLALSIAALAAAFRLPLYVSTSRSGRPSHVLAGLVSKVVLDKTNTITTSEMQVTGVLEAASQLVAQTPTRGSTLEAAIAACNYLAVIGEDKRIVGDPLEVALMKAIRWEVDVDDDSFVKRSVSTPIRATLMGATGTLSPVLENANTEVNVEALNQLLRADRAVTHAIQILASFPFNPVTMRMSVVAKLVESDRLMAFSKGAYEQIIAKCDPDSVPFALRDTHERLASLGYRILAYSYKPLPSGTEPETVQRDAIETDMVFAGIVLLSNELHPNSKAAIRDLRASDIQVFLCTGDNSGTAVAVARQCGITGRQSGILRTDSFIYRPSSLRDPLLADRGDDELVHSRMTPDDKAVFVEALAERERIGAVLMCGDGPNDANALCAADVGVVVNAHPNPLLESAAGCMACLDPQIGLRAVVEIITRGRSALAVIFCVAKIVIAYAVIEGTCVVLCYSVGTNLTDSQYGVVDMFILLPTVLLLALAAAPADSIYETRPLPPFRAKAIGIAFHCVMSMAWQAAALQALGMQDWYIPFTPAPRMLAGQHDWAHITTDLTGVENTVMFTMCCFQCILLIANFIKKGLDKWCTPLDDSPLVLIWIRMLGASVGLIAASTTILQDTFVGAWVMWKVDLVPLQGVFIFQLVILMVSQSIVSSLWEWSILPRIEREVVRDYLK